ncbi:hypothetical protein ACP179_17045 [Xenorhabdus stockiae]|uniref:hypothetical protein n=1 Tax=Xenorhabdus stockiae TaxID=351614 RepID=UPI003CF17F13
MSRILSACIALCIIVIPVKAVKANITVPIIYLDHAIPTISLNINGKEVNKIAIDTGASSAFYLPQSIFDSIFFAQNHRKEIARSSDIFGVEKSSVAAKETNITINGKKLSAVDVEVFKPWGNGMLDDNGDSIINGVLGLGIVKNKTLIINYASKILTIADDFKVLPDSHHWQTIPFTRTENGIELNVSSSDDKKVYRMLVDTGSSHTILFTRSKAGCIDLSLTCPKKNLVTPDGVKLSALLFSIDDDRINFDGLLGEDFLSNRILAISNDQLLISLPK